jgi:hypothetical protein
MLYVYKQFTRPINATGVEVTLSVLDSNGNYRDIGTTTSSADGFYSYSWVPDITGEYKVYASFAGSNAYYGSNAESAFTVDEAPQATVTPTTERATPAYDLYIIGMGIAIIVALAIATLLILRKRP